MFGGQTRHPGIVRVLDHGVTSIGGGEVPFYVMPRLGLDPSTVLPIFASLLDAVEAAHLSKVVHRDLKPENIFATVDSQALVVADFGIARFSEEELFTLIETDPNTRLANFQYAAPEQRLRGRVVDHRADIYALGLILVEMFTGEIPLGTGYRKIGASSPHHSYLDEIADNMLRQIADQRPGDIAEVKRALIAHKNRFVTQQRIDELSRTVVPVTAVTPPRPVTIQAVDIQGSNLIIKLNYAPSADWQSFYRQSANVSYVMGFPPRDFQISGDTMTIPARPGVFQEIIDSAKAALAQVSAAYAQFLQERAKQKEAEERRQLEAAAEAERNRLAHLKKLRF